MSATQTIKAGKGRLTRFAGRRVATFETPTTRLVRVPDPYPWAVHEYTWFGDDAYQWFAAPAVTRAGIVRVGS